MISVSMGIEWEFEGLNNYANFQFALKVRVLCCHYQRLLHSVLSLRIFCPCPLSFSTPSFWSSLEGTNWLHYVSQLLAVAVEVGEVMVGGAPALVHCSDGWDRTPQVVSLAKIILDPYYRTIEVRRVCGVNRT